MLDERTRATMMAANEVEPNRERQREFAFVLIKPMGMQYLERIVGILRQQGSVGNIKLIRTSRRQVESHYAASQYDENGVENYYYPGITSYLTEKEVCVLVIEDARDEKDEQSGFIDHLRKNVIGPSNPDVAAPGHIRRIAVDEGLAFRVKMTIPGSDKTSTCMDNLIHCSDSIENARREVALWYADDPAVIDSYRAAASPKK